MYTTFKSGRIYGLSLGKLELCKKQRKRLAKKAKQVHKYNDNKKPEGGLGGWKKQIWLSTKPWVCVKYGFLELCSPQIVKFRIGGSIGIWNIYTKDSWNWTF